MAGMDLVAKAPRTPTTTTAKLAFSPLFISKDSLCEAPDRQSAIPASLPSASARRNGGVGSLDDSCDAGGTLPEDKDHTHCAASHRNWVESTEPARAAPHWHRSTPELEQKPSTHRSEVETQFFHHQEMLPAARVGRHPCLEHDHSSNATASMKQRVLDINSKRWIFCEHVWIRTGKPKPRDLFGIQWCRRLLFLDGIGGLYYISEYRRGARVYVCDKGSIVMVAAPQATEETEPRPAHIPALPGIKITYVHRAECARKSTHWPENHQNASSNAHGIREHSKGQCSFWFVPESEAAFAFIRRVLESHLVRLGKQGKLGKMLSSASAFAMNGTLDRARKIVSGNRRRYVDEYYDLDLTYITTRIIAMAFPGVDTVGQFASAVRNDLREVVKFLQERHHRRFKVFNLCAEKVYSPLYFEGQVEWIPVIDHQPPTLRQMKLFCSSASRWLLAHPDNIIAVHCKGGKGRTGCMVSAILAQEGQATCAESGEKLTFERLSDVLQLFHRRRTLDPVGPSQGVTGISQLRFMNLFWESLQSRGVVKKMVRVTHVNVVTVPNLPGEKVFEAILLIHSFGESKTWIVGGKGSSPDTRAIASCLAKTGTRDQQWPCGSDETVEFDFEDMKVVFSEDFRLELHNGRPHSGQEDHLEHRRVSDLAVAFATYHTSILQKSPLVLQADDVDKGFSYKKHRELLLDGFRLEIHFEEISSQPEGIENVSKKFSRNRGDSFRASSTSLFKGSMRGSLRRLSTASSLKASPPTAGASSSKFANKTTGCPTRQPNFPQTDHSHPVESEGILRSRNGIINAITEQDKDEGRRSDIFQGSRSFLQRGQHLLKRRASTISSSSLTGSAIVEIQEENTSEAPAKEKENLQYLIFNEDIESDFISIIKGCERSSVGPGEIALAAGSTTRRLALVTAGSLRAEIFTKQSVTVLKPMIGVNDIVGVLSCLLDNVPVYADFVTNQDSELCFLNPPQLTKLFDEKGKLWLLFHYLSIHLSTTLVQIIERGNTSKVKSTKESHPSLSAKLSSRLQIPVSERIMMSCMCRATCTLGIVRGSGVLRLTRNYLVFERSSFFGRSALLRLDKLAHVGSNEEVSPRSMALEYTRSIVSRRTAELKTSRIEICFHEDDARSIEFQQVLRQLTNTQMTLEMAVQDFRQSCVENAKKTGGRSGEAFRFPLPYLFEPSAGSSSLLVFKPGQIVSSKLGSGLRKLCCIWQGAAVSVMHGNVIRRSEFCDLLFLEDFLWQGQLTPQTVTAALDQPLVVAAVTFAKARLLLEQDVDLRTKFYEYCALQLALNLQRLGPEASIVAGTLSNNDQVSTGVAGLPTNIAQESDSGSCSDSIPDEEKSLP